MSNCHEDTGVSPDATLNEHVADEQCNLDESGLSIRKWPHTRQALLVARIDEELAKLPRREWFDRALQVEMVDAHRAALAEDAQAETALQVKRVR